MFRGEGMTYQTHDEMFRKVFKSVFGVPATFGLEEAAKKFSHGLRLPKEIKPAIGKELVYTADSLPKMASLKELESRYNSIDMLLPKKPINSLKDIAKLMDNPEVFVCGGNKFLNSQECEKSDNYYSSTHVYGSAYIYDSKFVGLSTDLTKCEYVYGSHHTTNSSLCIRVQDSNFLNNCFEVSWSAKTSNSLFCHGVVNTRDCMFSFHIASKQYVIANRQYTQEEYEKIKKMVVEKLVKEDFALDFFPRH